MYKFAVLLGLVIGGLSLVANAKAHIIRLKPETDGHKIITLRKRIAHDRHMINGTWRPIGQNWFVQAVNRIDAYTHRKDLPKALRLYRVYWAKLGDVNAWNCIHRGEAPWNSTKNPTYDGGLQMDSTFQSTYGSDMLRAYGLPAWAWHPYDQMIVAERARRSGRGYYPWPRTARHCGLI